MCADSSSPAKKRAKGELAPGPGTPERAERPVSLLKSSKTEGTGRSWRIAPCCGLIVVALFLASWAARRSSPTLQLTANWAATGAATETPAPPPLVAAAAASVARADPPRQCTPPSLVPSPWSSHCQHLQRVCVDQGTLIFYDEQYQETEDREAAPLPSVDVDNSKLYIYPWRSIEHSSAEAAATAADTSVVDGGTVMPDGGADGVRAGSAGRPQRRLLRAAGQGVRQQQQRQLLGAQPDPFKKRRLKPLPSRAASSQEPTAYLARPAFSICTVPIVVYPILGHNFAHVFHDLASFLHALLRRTPWRDHAKLVVVTPGGLALTQPEAQLLPPLTQLSVQTWADFSSRLPRNHDPAAQGWGGRTPRPHSYEGSEQRCFRHMLVCGRRFRAWRALEQPFPEGKQAAVEELSKAIPRENYAFGQMLVQHVQQRQQQQTQASRVQQQLQQPQNTGSSNSLGSSSAVSRTGGAEQGPRRLKILFMKRGGEGRQILNVAELVSRCNVWQYEPPGSGSSSITAECREVELSSLEAGVEAAQEADVFVGVHGANLVNSWLMRPGSSAIEISPHEFGFMNGSFGLSFANAQDPSSQLLWWLAVVCDPAISEPGPDEAAGRGKPQWWARDRSTRLPWQALEAILQEVVAVGGDRQRYIDEYYSRSLHRFNVGARGVVSRGVGPAGEHSGCPAAESRSP